MRFPTDSIYAWSLKQWLTRHNHWFTLPSTNDLVDDMSTRIHPIRLAREAAGLTQQELADLVGVSGAAVSAWERFVADPSPTIATRCCSHLPTLTLDAIYTKTEAAA